WYADALNSLSQFQQRRRWRLFCHDPASAANIRCEWTWPSPVHPEGCCSSRCSAVRRPRGLTPRSRKGAREHRRLMQKGIVINLLDKEIRDVGAWDEPASPVEGSDPRAVGVWTSGRAETPSDWMTTPTPLSAPFTVAVASGSPAVFSNLGWSTGILRADRASARTECPPRGRPSQSQGRSLCSR